jgi:hypothetical protein
MGYRDGLPEFRELRVFAMEEIPRILREEGGTIGKAQLHARVRERFVQVRGGWPEELDGIGLSGCTRGTNAIAWALATLTSRMITQPCLGSDVVCLRRGDRQVESGPGRAAARPRGISGYGARIEEAVRERARQAMRRAAAANLPFDGSFVEDSVRAVRKAGYRCAISRRPFDIDYRTQGAGGTHYAPSPDRVVPERGYVRGNVRWVLWCLNRGKGEMTADDYFEICRLVASSRAEPSAQSGATHSSLDQVTRVDIGKKPDPEGYTIQQIAAFKAHITMLRKSLPGLTGGAKAAALKKLAQHEARLAAATTSEE